MAQLKVKDNKEVTVDDKYFHYLSEFNWRMNAQGYAARSVCILSRKESRDTGKNRHKNILLHRAIMVLDGKLNGIDDERQIDHINRNRTDNRLDNMRVCEIGSSTNAVNATRRKDNTSGYKGVNMHKGKWCARVQYKGKRYEAGYYNTPEEAALGYNRKALELHGDQAVLNQL